MFSRIKVVIIKNDNISFAEVYEMSEIAAVCLRKIAQDYRQQWSYNFTLETEIHAVSKAANTSPKSIYLL